jgi:hypothetical protein
MYMTKRLLTLVPISLVVLASVPQMNAGVSLMLSDGTNCASISDTGAVTSCGGTNSILASYTPGPGAAALDGTIVALGSLGEFTLNVTTGRGGGAETLPSLLNLNSIDADAGGTGTLTITLTDSDVGNFPEYSDLSGLLNLSSSGTITASTSLGSSISFTGDVDSSLIGVLGPFTMTSAGTATSLASTQNFSNPVGPAGSLSEIATLSFGSTGGEIDSGFTISNVATVPEPASIVFLGTMILGLTAVIRKKQVNRS